MAPVGALLWRSLRTYQIYGANTDVGKTVFASALCNAARNFWPQDKTAFLKPVSTGPATEADDRCALLPTPLSIDTIFLLSCS